MARGALERRVLVPLLVCYAVILVTAAWRHEIRPRLLDRPAGWARSALDLVGIPPGVAVFTEETSTPRNSKLVALCLRVRVVDVDGRVHEIYPPAGRECPQPAARLWIRGEQIALYRLAATLVSAANARRKGSAGRRQADLPELLLESLADHFRARAHAEGLAPDRYALLWTESRVNYRSGEPSEEIVSLIRWREQERPVLGAWHPDSRKLEEHWPSLEAPWAP